MSQTTHSTKNKLKIKRSPPKTANQAGDPLNFTKDMKRLGIMTEVQGV
jgi:hypothetical protein